MSLRKILLFVMLGALAAAAFAGAAGIFLASDATFWRITGTAIATAVAAGLLLPASLLVDRAKVRAAGFAAMATLLAIWLLTNAAIWFDALGAYWEYLESTLMAMGATIAFGLAATITLLFISFKSARVAVILQSTAMAVLLLIAYIAAILEAAPGSYGDELYATVWALAAGVTLIAFTLVNLGLDRRFVLCTIGILATLIATTIAVIGIFVTSHEDFWGYVMAVSFAIGIGSAFTNLCLQARAAGTQAILKWATIAIAWIGVLCVFGLVLADYFDDLFPPGANTLDDFFGRCTMAAAILAGCGALALIVVSRLNRRVDATTETFIAQTLTLFCPRCQKKQELPLGDAACTSCGLRITTRIEEPRCPTCNYLLYKLTTDRCPKCGTTIGTTTPPQPPLPTVIPKG